MSDNSRDNNCQPLSRIYNNTTSCLIDLLFLLVVAFQ